MTYINEIPDEHQRHTVWLMIGVHVHLKPETHSQPKLSRYMNPFMNIPSSIHRNEYPTH